MNTDQHDLKTIELSKLDLPPTLTAKDADGSKDVMGGSDEVLEYDKIKQIDYRGEKNFTNDDTGRVCEEEGDGKKKGTKDIFLLQGSDI